MFGVTSNRPPDALGRKPVNKPISFDSEAWHATILYKIQRYPIIRAT
jgi:hypothetical protein